MGAYLAPEPETRLGRFCFQNVIVGHGLVNVWKSQSRSGKLLEVSVSVSQIYGRLSVGLVNLWKSQSGSGKLLEVSVSVS